MTQMQFDPFQLEWQEAQEFDPFQLEEQTLADDLERPVWGSKDGSIHDPFKLSSSSDTVEDRWRPSIVDRARKRTCTRIGPSSYKVGKLDGDKYDRYIVAWNPDTDKWDCECHHYDHGETRARSGCSHVVRVLLERQDNNDGKLSGSVKGGQEDNGRGIGQDTQVAETQMLQGPSVSLPVSPILLPSLNDPRLVYPGTPTLPAWVQEIYPHQWQAAQEVDEEFNSGVDVVFLSAPTGSGKTLIAELVRRLQRARGLYVCSTKTLQDQFIQDFPYARMLKGRSNYPTQSMPYPDYTAADCTKDPGPESWCYWCPEVSTCAYEMAKSAALNSDLAVINTAYLLAECNYVGNMRGRDLVIADECDVLENELMGFVEFKLGDRLLAGLGVEAPKKGVHKKTILTWLVEELQPAIGKTLLDLPKSSDNIQTIRRRGSLDKLAGDVRRIIRDLTTEIESKGEDAEVQGAENWIRDNDAGPMVLKPVKVAEYGGNFLWQHGKKWLCMSATIISAEEMAESLGIVEAGLTYSVVEVPMTFPVENREIHVVPVASMTNKLKEESWPKMAKMLQVIMEKHPHDRILVHTVSYDLAKFLHRILRSSRCLIYTEGSQRDSTLSEFRRREGAVLLAASMDRGVDLKGEDCRVIVVPKMPFPNLGDRQVSSRLRGEGGQSWYNVQTIRTLVQMTGRGVRSKDDWCVTYVLDEQFIKNIWKKSKGLVPKWWAEAVRWRRVREFI